MFFPVTRLKLVVTSIVTFGLYELYWFCRNWKLLKQRTAPDLMPFWRAFFALFFRYSLFREFKDSAVLRSVSAEFSPGLFAAAVGPKEAMSLLTTDEQKSQYAAQLELFKTGQPFRDKD